jgi:predicted porin
MGATAVRASNGVSYLTPNTLGGFFVQATYALGGNPNGTLPDGATSRDGDYSGINIGYQNGPIYVGVATSYDHQGQTLSASPVEVGEGDVHVTNFGASYDFGVVKPDLFYQTATVNAAPEQYTTSIYSAGLVVPLGQGEFRFNYGHASGKDYLSGSHANMFGLGYVYNLSKRTALYGIYAHMSNSGDYAFPLNAYSPGPAPGDTASGVTIGLRTSF